MSRCGGRGIGRRLRRALRQTGYLPLCDLLRVKPRVSAADSHLHMLGAVSAGISGALRRRWRIAAADSLSAADMPWASIGVLHRR